MRNCTKQLKNIEKVDPCLIISVQSSFCCTVDFIGSIFLKIVDNEALNVLLRMSKFNYGRLRYYCSILHPRILSVRIDLHHLLVFNIAVNLESICGVSGGYLTLGIVA